MQQRTQMSVKYILGLNQIAKGQKYKILLSDKGPNIISTSTVASGWSWQAVPVGDGFLKRLSDLRCKFEIKSEK